MPLLGALVRREAWLKTRRGLAFLTVVTLVGVGLVRVAMYWGGMPGWDDAAHVYKVFLLREGYGVLWDSFWYGGSYGAITYGVVYYWFAQYIPGPVIVTVASGLLPALFYLYYSRAWGLDDVWPAWMLAGVLGVYQANGQDPFLVALCLSMGGLALLAAGRPAVGAVLTGVGLFANPLGLFVAGVLLLGDLAGRPALRRRILVFGLCGLPFLALEGDPRGRLRRAELVPQRAVEHPAVRELRAGGRRARRPQRRAPAPSVRAALRHLRPDLSGLVRAADVAGQQRRPLLLRPRPAAALPAPQRPAAAARSAPSPW